MIETELEILLKSAGIELRDRMYPADIITAAKIDSIDQPVLDSSGTVVSILKNALKQWGHSKYIALAEDLDEDASDRDPLLFLREIRPQGNYSAEFTVRPKERVFPKSEAKIDRIIAKNDYDCAFDLFYYDWQGKPKLVATIDHNTKRYAKVDKLVIEFQLDIFDPILNQDLLERCDQLSKYNGQKYTPKTMAKAVAEFITGNPEVKL